MNASFYEYAKRLPTNFALNLIEIAPLKRHKNCAIQQIKQQEGALLMAALAGPHGGGSGKGGLVVALDEHGALWSTQELAQHLQQWQNSWPQVNFLVGGADGLSQECLQRAEVRWSLSKLTFPHHLVRVIVAEQIYRAWSLLHHHPYHRA